MTVIPKKLNFQLYFRNKTNTRKILSRNFRLGKLLKKNLNNACNINYFFLRKKKQNQLFKNFFIAFSLKIKKQDTIKIVNKVKNNFNNNNLKEYIFNLRLFKKHLNTNDLEVKNTFVKVQNKLEAKKKRDQNYLTKPNKYLYIQKKKSFFKPFWYLTNRIIINKNYDIYPKNIQSSYLQFENQRNNNSFNLQKFTGLFDENRYLPNNIFKPNNIFLKKKAYIRNSRINKLLFGRYGVCFKRYSIISSKYVETAKLDIAKILRKKGRFWVRICCDTPISARPAETRMGKGKGSISHWGAQVSPGQLFFEFSGISQVQLKEIYKKLCKKSAVNLKTIY